MTAHPFPLPHFIAPAEPVSINITFNGPVHFGTPEPEIRVATDPNVYYVTPEGDALLGGFLQLADLDASAFGDAVPALTPEAFAAFVAALTAEPEAAPAPLKVRPTVGRIVHYQPTDEERVHHGSKGYSPWAALITGVLEVGDFEDGADIVSLMVFPPCRSPFVPMNSVAEGGPDEKGAWSWPPRA